MRGFRNLSGVVAVLLGALALTAAASGHSSPAGCVGVGPQVSFSSLSQLDGFSRNGDTIPVGATISNNGQSACDVSGLKVSVRFPTPEGEPGEEVELVSGLDLPAASRPRDLTEVASHVIDFEEGVYEAPVSLDYSFTLHSGSPDSVVDGKPVESLVKITRPRAALTVESSVASGAPPLKVTYTYELTNTSPATPAEIGPTPAIASSNPFEGTNLITDDNCQSIEYVSGNAGTEFPPTLDPAGEGTPAETWKFTCSRTYEKPGTYASSPSISAVSTVDGRQWPAPEPTTTETDVLGPDLAVEKSHVGDFIAGGTGEYTLAVSNGGNRPSWGRVLLEDRLPEGLTATAIGGTGWECDLPTLICIRSDSLPSGGSFPDVTVAVTVSKSPPASVTNRAFLQNDSQNPGANDTDDDATKIRTPGVPAGLPSNHFVVKWTRVRSNGAVLIKIKVPGPGLIVADDVKRKPDLFRIVIKRARKPGSKKIELRPNPKLRKRLARSDGPVNARIKLTFAPLGGLTASRRLKIALRPG